VYGDRLDKVVSSMRISHRLTPTEQTFSQTVIVEQLGVTIWCPPLSATGQPMHKLRVSLIVGGGHELYVFGGPIARINCNMLLRWRGQ
jgi:hypothetical protein